MAKEKEEYLFEKRYTAEFNLQRLEYSKKEALDKYKAIVQDNIQRVASAKIRPQAMQYFDKLFLEQEARLRELEEFKKQGGKIIGTFCVLVPEEVIYAAGMIPVRLCSGFYNTIYAGEEVLPKNVCPTVKSIMGFMNLGINPYFDLCDAFVVPATCDAKKKSAEVISEFAKVFTLDLPSHKDPRESQEYWLTEVKRFKSNLEKFSGKRITVDKLKNSMQMIHNRTAAFRRLLELKKSNVPRISGRDTLLVSYAVNYDSQERWIDATNRLCDEIEREQQPVVGGESLRVMVTGSPFFWPNWKILHIIEETGATVVIDDLCSGTQSLYNPLEVHEWTPKAMLQAIADKYLSPCICPCFVHSDDRLDRILELCEQYKVEGIVYNVIRLCQIFDLEFARAEKILNKKGFPLLKIESEFSLEDIGQIKTRVEAFFEILKTRREVRRAQDDSSRS